VSGVSNLVHDVVDNIYYAVGGNEFLYQLGQYNFLFWRH
jgi:hypothetical protein